MDKFLRSRSMFTFTSIVLGIILFINLVKLATAINGGFIIYPYMIGMGGAIFASTMGYIKRDPRALGVGNVLWIVTLAFNLPAFVFIVPIGILNIIGRNNMMNKMELEEKLKNEEEQEKSHEN